MDARFGEYNSMTKQSNFYGRTRIIYSDYVLYADKVRYNQFQQLGYAHGNVEIFSAKDSITFYGDEAVYKGGAISTTKIYPSALMQIVSKGDSLFVSADTLYAINDTVSEIKNKKLLAYHHTKVFNRQFQAICDSLVNDILDSTIYFFKDPVLWNEKNQMRGDTVVAVSKNKKIERIHFNRKAFSISEDTLLNYNQVRGKRMTAYFENNEIKNIFVKDDAETIYFALIGDTAVSGLNHVLAKDMNVKFENKKLKTISFYVKPKAEFVPEHEINDNIIRLAGFKWRISERPDLQKTIGKYYQNIILKNKKLD
jgi:hypothetical protein